MTNFELLKLSFEVAQSTVWRGKANRLNAVGDLADLFLRVRARITRMRFDVIERDRVDRTNARRRRSRTVRIVVAA